MTEADLVSICVQLVTVSRSRADPAGGALALSLWTEAPKAIADLVGEGAEAARMVSGPIWPGGRPV